MKTKPNWIIEGIIAGLIFLVIISFIDLLSGDFSIDRLWTKVIVYLVTGLGYGFTMKYFRRKKN